MDDLPMLGPEPESPNHSKLNNSPAMNSFESPVGENQFTRDLLVCRKKLFSDDVQYEAYVNMYVDKDVEWGGVEVGGKSKGMGKIVENVDMGKGKLVENVGDSYETDYLGSDELLSDCSDSNNDGNSLKKPKFTIFNFKVTWKILNLN